MRTLDDLKEVETPVRDVGVTVERREYLEGHRKLVETCTSETWKQQGGEVLLENSYVWSRIVRARI